MNWGGLGGGSLRPLVHLIALGESHTKMFTAGSLGELNSESSHSDL